MVSGGDRADHEKPVNRELAQPEEGQAGHETQREACEGENRADQGEGEREREPRAGDMATAQHVGDRTEPETDPDDEQSARETPPSGSTIHESHGLCCGHVTRLYVPDAREVALVGDDKATFDATVPPRGRGEGQEFFRPGKSLSLNSWP